MYKYPFEYDCILVGDEMMEIKSMAGSYLKNVNGGTIDSKEIEDLSKRVVHLIMSELPEEARTFEIAMWVLEMAKDVTKGLKITMN